MKIVFNSSPLKVTNIGLRVIMDDREKAELNKQKKLVDCVGYCNYVLEAFDRLEEYKARVIPMIDGFDLTHADTYLELTDNLKRELFYIRLFSQNAAQQLVEYRRLCHPERDINSRKERKSISLYGEKSSVDWEKQSKEMQLILDESQKQMNEILEKQRERNLEKSKYDSVEDVKNKLDEVSKKKREKQIQLKEKVVKIESRILKLEWAIFLILVLQAAIFIKLVVM